MLRKIFTTSCLFLFFTAGIFAQSALIKGVVVDSEGTPLPGVSVRVKNNPTKGASTSIDGKYVVADVVPSDSIEFTYIGFNPQTFLVSNRTEIDVVMYETSIELEEFTVDAFNSNGTSAMEQSFQARDTII